MGQWSSHAGSRFRPSRTAPREGHDGCCSREESGGGSWDSALHTARMRHRLLPHARLRSAPPPGQRHERPSLPSRLRGSSQRSPRRRFLAHEEPTSRIRFAVGTCVRQGTVVRCLMLRVVTYAQRQDAGRIGRGRGGHVAVRWLRSRVKPTERRLLLEAVLRTRSLRNR